MNGRPRDHDPPADGALDDGPLSPALDDGPLSPALDDRPLGPALDDRPLGPALDDGPLGPALDDGPLGPRLDARSFDPSGPLTPSGHLRRRQLLSRLVESGHTISALLAVSVLALVVYSVASRGASALSIDFLTKDPPPLEGQQGGGIAPAIVGTALLMGLATAIAMPLGVLVALYLSEFAGQRPARAVRLALDLLNGLPSIVIGLFVFGLLVAGSHQSGFAGAVALAIVMLPLIASAAYEVLALVPAGLREAADALGVSRWRTVRGVLLPSALGGVLTATVLAAARAAGETAPLLFACSIYSNRLSSNLFGGALASLPVYIFKASEAADPYGFARAWGAAFILLVFILVASLAGRALLNRSRARLVR